jgi:hypothetical protein
MSATRHNWVIAGNVTAASAIGLDVNLFAQGHLGATRGGSDNCGGANDRAHAECRTDYTIIASAPERSPACRLA